MKWYKKICQQIGRINNRELELKKETVYEGNKNKWCNTLHRISSMKEILDFAMRQMKFSEKSHIKYVSFLNSIKNKRIGGLQLNKYTNIKLKYEYLENVGVLDQAKYQE